MFLRNLKKYDSIMSGNCFAILIVLAFLSVYSVQGQNKADLEKKREEALKIIENTTRLLEQATHSRRSSVERLNIVNNRINQRQTLINTIEAEIRFIDNSILNSQVRIVNLENELKEARDAYERLIIIANKHRFSHQIIMFILSADNFNQAYRRFKYIMQYSESRKKQIVRIEELTNDIIKEIEDLEDSRDQKAQLLVAQRDESSFLIKERQQQNTILQDLQAQEKKLREELERQRKIAQAIERTIEDLLKSEADIAARDRVYSLTPAEKIISDEFKNNMGGLPWPTERGVVTGYFGEHPHPVLKGIKIQNNGIDISTVENAEVRSLFNGVVRQVLSLPGTNNVVIIRHGNFLSVYANLSHVFVRKDDTVNTGQLIGRVFTDRDSNNSSVLHLEIWEENRKLDPILWLSRQ
jgi:murein hydrolase activator